MATPKIPPGGFLGAGSQTAAVQHLTNKAMGPKRRRTTKKRTTKKRTARKRPAKRRASTARKKKPARLVKGSAAAKRHMAKLRRMRRKR